MVGLHHQITNLQLMRDGKNGIDDDEHVTSSCATEANDVARFCNKQGCSDVHPEAQQISPKSVSKSAQNRAQF